MAHGGYEYESGGLMPMIRALVKPPDELVSHPKPKKPLHPYYKRPGKGHNHDCCDACNEGGDLICCDRCPASFHLMCYDPPLEQEDIPAGMWLCKTCRTYDVDSDGYIRPGSPHRMNKRIRKRGNSSAKAKEKKNRKKKAEARKNEAKREKLRLEEARKLEIRRQCTSLNTGEGSNPDAPKLTAMDLLVKAASMMNPMQFDLPEELKIPVTFPGTEKGKPRQVPAHMKECYACLDHMKKAPLIACDYCDCFFHQDCLNPPLTALPIGRWMCPNHVEHFLDSKMLTSISLTERTALWDKWGGPIDEQAIKAAFLRRGRDVNRMFRMKVPAPPAILEEVPAMVRQHYVQPPSQLPSRKEYSRSIRVLKNLKLSGTYNESDEEADMDEQTKPRICLSASCPWNMGEGPCPYEGTHSQDDRASPLITEREEDEESCSPVLEEDEETGPVVTAKEYKAPHSDATAMQQGKEPCPVVTVQQQDDGPCPMDTQELKDEAVDESISEKDTGYENEFPGEESTVHYQKSIGEEDSDQDIEYSGVTQGKSTTYSKSVLVDIADHDIEFVSQDDDEYPKEGMKDSSDVAKLDDDEDVYQHQKSTDVENTAHAVEFVSQDVGVRYQKPIGVENIGDGVEFVVGADGVHYQKPIAVQDTIDDVRFIAAGDTGHDNEFIGDEDAVHYQKSIGDEDAEQDIEFVGDEDAVHYQETIGDDDPDQNIEIVEDKDAKHYYEYVEDEEDDYDNEYVGQMYSDCETKRLCKTIYGSPAVYYQKCDEKNPAYEDEVNRVVKVVYFRESARVEKEDQDNQFVGEEDANTGVKRGAEEDEEYEDEFVGEEEDEAELVDEEKSVQNHKTVGEEEADPLDEFGGEEDADDASECDGEETAIRYNKPVRVEYIGEQKPTNDNQFDSELEAVHYRKSVGAEETDRDNVYEYEYEIEDEDDAKYDDEFHDKDNKEHDSEPVGEVDTVHYQKSVGVKEIDHDDKLNEQRTDQSVEFIIEEQVDVRDKLVNDPKKETDGNAVVEYENKCVGEEDTVHYQKPIGEDDAEREVEFVGDEEAVHYQKSIGDEDEEQDLVIIGEQLDYKYVGDNYFADQEDYDEYVENDGEERVATRDYSESVASEKEDQEDQFVGEEGQEDAECEDDVSKQDADRVMNVVGKEDFDQDSENDCEDEEDKHDTEDDCEYADEFVGDEYPTNRPKSVDMEDAHRDREIVGKDDMESDKKLVGKASDKGSDIVGEDDAEPDRAEDAENKEQDRPVALHLSDHSDSELEERIRNTVRKRRALSAASRRGRAPRAFSAREARGAAAAAGAATLLLTGGGGAAALHDANGRLLGLDQDLVRVLAWQRMLQIAAGQRVPASRRRGSGSSERSASPDRRAVTSHETSHPVAPVVLQRADRERVAAAVWGPRPASPSPSPASPAAAPRPRRTPRLELRNALIKASLVRVSTRPGAKISKLGSPLAMRKSSLVIGTESNSDLVLDPSCRCVSPLHAVIFYDEVTSHFEMLNYSEWGSSVNGVVYACDVGAARRGEDPASAAGRAEARAALLRDLVRDRVPPQPKLDVPLTTDPEYRCGCDGRAPSAAYAWEGTALVAHGALVQFGCYRFVFCITGASWKSRMKANAENPAL